MTNTLKRIAQRAESYEATVEASYQIAQSAIKCGIPGDFVECGVFAGSQAAAMALASMNMYGDETRRVHLFDTFRGVPAAGPHDTEWIAAGHPIGQSACSRQQVAHHMLEWGIDPRIFIYHEGLFEHTLKDHGIKSIAVLRIDCDLYSGTAGVSWRLDHLR